MCSIWEEESSFYSGGRWPWRSARVAVVVVVPGRRRGKGWVRTIVGVLARLTRMMAVKTRLGSDGEVDGSVRHRGGQSSSWPSPAAFPRASGHVQAVQGEVLRLLAQRLCAEVTRGLRAADALGVPGCSPCAHWRVRVHVWARLAMSISTRCE